MLACPRNRVPLLFHPTAHLSVVRHLQSTTDPYEDDYVNLGVASTVDAAGARDAFIRLAKECHPDSGHASADESKFKRLDKSYRRLLQKFSDERHNHAAVDGEYGLYYEIKRKAKERNEASTSSSSPVDDGEEQSKGFYTLKSKTLQHRQYLSYEGIGMGSPAQRERQYSKYKALRATENVIDFKVQQLQQEYPESGLVAQERNAAKQIKTRYGIERMVEDLIQESMARGEFDNLANAGKPLQYDCHSPYIDLATHKLNQVLIDNGYAPGWVMLEREIRDDKEWIRVALRGERARLGDLPLTAREQTQWHRFIAKLEPYVLDLNRKIDNYNLLVPILNKQLVHFPVPRVADKILSDGATKHHPDAKAIASKQNIVPSAVVDDDVSIHAKKNIASTQKYSLQELFNSIFKL
uniref:DnaJ homolog subfamily C member 28-like isoform X1 n=2 Tax=Hirondellea gigas TaxID=1518452 RepID=A0A6A7FTP0_9CRUS